MLDLFSIEVIRSAHRHICGCLRQKKLHYHRHDSTPLFYANRREPKNRTAQFFAMLMYVFAPHALFVCLAHMGYSLLIAIVAHWPLTYSFFFLSAAIGFVVLCSPLKEEYLVD